MDREESLSTLSETFGKVVAEGSGRVVFIKGEPGIGKTSLVRKFLGHLDEENVLSLETYGREFTTSPFMGLSEMFAPLFKSKSPLKHGKQIAVTVLNISRLVPTFGQFAGVAADALKEFRGLSEADARIIPGSIYLKNVFMTLFEKLSRKKPVVAFFDDAQWFDSSSLEVLGYLIEQASKFRAMLIICLRRGYPASEREQANLQTLENVINRIDSETVMTLNVEQLPKDASGEIVRQMFQPRIPVESQIDSLVDRTGGNPLLISKVVRAILSQYSDTLQGGSIRYAYLWKIVPKSISDMVSKQLLEVQKENLTARLALDYASIIGRAFFVGDVAQIMGSDGLVIKHLFEALESNYGVVHATDDVDVYEFDHEITREVIMSLMGSIGKQVHRKVAEYYSVVGRAESVPNLVAYHYEIAGEYGKAFELYRIAARDATKNYSFADASKYLEKCLSLVESALIHIDRGSYPSLLFELADAKFSNGNFSESLTAVSRIFGLQPILDQVFAGARLLAGRCCRYIGTADAGVAGIEHLRQAAALFESLNNQQELGTTFSALSTLLDHYGDHEEAVTCFGRSQKAFNLANDSIGLAVLQRKSGMIYDSRRAIDFIKTAMEVFRRTNATIELARCLNNLGAEECYIGAFESAKTNFLEAIETYRKIDSYEIDASLNNLGLVYMQTGQMKEAYQVLKEAEKRTSEDFNKICSSTNLATLDRLSGNVAESYRRLSELIPLVAKSGEILIQDYFAFNMAMVLDKLGRPPEALEWLERFPPNNWKGDIELVRAKRLKAKSIMLQKLGRKEAEEPLREAEAVFRTTRPQKWFYQLDYYPCDIHILD